MAKTPNSPYERTMNTITATKATMQAMVPASMLSCPSVGLTVRSSRKVNSAGSAPALSRTARSVDSSTEKLPVICPDPPVIASWICGAVITSSSRTTAKSAPTFSEV